MKVRNGRTHIGLEMPIDLKLTLDMLAERKDLTLSALVRQLLAAGLASGYGR